MTNEQAERERREESLRRCLESEKAAKARMRDEYVVFGVDPALLGHEKTVTFEVEGHQV